MRARTAFLVASVSVSVFAAGCGGGGGGGTASGGTTPPGTTPAAVASAAFDDRNGDGQVGVGDAIVVRFDREVVLGIGASAPSAADFRLPVAGDTLGQGASVGGGQQADEVDITLGQNPFITVDGVFDAASSSAGDPSGIDLALGVTPGAIADVNGLDAKSAGLVDVSGSATPPPPPGGPTVIDATFTDVNQSGTVDGGDELVLRFSQDVTIGAPVLGDLDLPVAGDALGFGAVFAAGVAPDEMLVTLGQGATLTPDGLFDAAATNAGDPSGIDVSATITAGSIVSVSGLDAESSAAVDVGGFLPPPPPPPPGPSVIAAVFDDRNGSGAVDQGDRITLQFDEDVDVGFGAAAPVAADLDLPVAGDSLGQGPAFASGASDEVVITLGSGATITPDGAFDPNATIAGDPSGIDIAAGIGAGRIVSSVTGSSAQPSAAVDVDGVLGPPTGPIVIGAEFLDVDGSGFIDAGDTLTVEFSTPVILASGANAPVAQDFVLAVSGDQLAFLSDVSAHPIDPEKVVIEFTQGGSVFEPNGTFDPAVTAAGSPSGIDVDAGLPSGVITDIQGRNARASTPTDIGGSIVRPTPPEIVGAVFVDADLSGDASDGDQIIVAFDQDVKIALNTSAADFDLPVAGDDLGQGATFEPGPSLNELAITLGATPNLTATGVFDAANLGAGASSGIDIAAGIAPLAIQNRHAMDAVPAGVASDVAEPGVSVVEDFATDVNQDQLASSADWNLGGSGALEGSLVRFDVGSGTDPLLIDTDTTIDTDAGTIGGAVSAGFRGAGVFEFDTVEIRKGVNVQVTGRAPLTLKAAGDATIDGTIILDGQAGADQPNLSQPGAAGGLGGPGGFDGGDGADGGLEIADDGAGPAGGKGGHSENFPGGGGGAGFGTAGTDGETPTGTGSGAGGLGAAAIAFDGTTLHGGSGGGGGGGDDDFTLGIVDSGDEGGGGGGGGGGAMRVVSGGTIRVAGRVSADGGDGGEGLAFTGGGGGGAGSGGAIIFQAVTDVIIAGGASLSALGGEGADGFALGGNAGDGVILVETANGTLQQLPPAVSGSVFPIASEAISSNVNPGAGTDPFEILADAVVNTDTGEVDGVIHPTFRGNGEFEASRLNVAAGATLRVEGSQPIQFRVLNNVTIAGTVDLDGADGEPASGLVGGIGGLGRAGGENGGNGGSLILTGTPPAVSQSIEPTDGQGSGAGAGATNATDNAGGGGASFGSSGTAGLGVAAGVGAVGAEYGTDDLATLEGGSGGGGGNADTATDFGGGGGGGAGGGAFAIFAGGEVIVSGRISANGGDGGASQRGGNGGAGSGGAILITTGARIAVPGVISAAGGDGGTDGGHGGHGRVRLEDSAGSFTVGVVEPAITTAPFSTSAGVSTFVRSVDGAGQPAVDPIWLAIAAAVTEPAGTRAIIEFEGADDDGAGAPDLATRTGFTADTTALAGKEHVRFRVTFKSDLLGGAKPSVDAVGLIGR